MALGLEHLLVGIHLLDAFRGLLDELGGGNVLPCASRRFEWWRRRRHPSLEEREGLGTAYGTAVGVVNLFAIKTETCNAQTHG
jgi:hypothetical protein